MCREWTWHHKSSGDSRATDHRGQSRAHRKCIPSPHSHCPHWCLFKPASDTWRDCFSCWKKINKKNLLPLHPRLQCFKGARLPSAARGQTGTPSPPRLSTSYLPHPASLFLAVISTAVTHFLRPVSKQKPDGFTITASLQIREHFHGLDCREKPPPPTITNWDVFFCKIKWKYCSTECILTQSGTEYFSFNTFNMYP